MAENGPAPRPAVPDPNPTDRPAVPKDGDAIARDPEGIRVIVIDDEEGMREGMRRVLERRGFLVRTARDGETALRLLEEGPSDVALVDLKMPGIDGFKVTEHITRRFQGRTVVVIVSALATVEAAVEVTQHGAFDFLVKPFTPDDLLQVMNRAVQQWRLIREREKYLSELAGERSLSHQMISSMHEGVAVLNIRREVVLLNPRAEHFLGRRFREGMCLPDLFSDLDVGAAIEAVIDSAPERPECRIAQLSTGGERLQVGISPLLRDGEAGGAIVILTDVTESWKAEQDKNRFVSMVAHELKSPLSAIINYINVILTGMFDDDKPKIREMLERCKVRGEALLDLVRDLLYINSREVGKAERSIEALDLKAAIAAQLEFFRVQTDKRRITTLLEAPLPAYPVKADRGDLDRIFMNLISNAIKYNRDKGSLTVRIAEAGAGWEVSISDTGIGMSDAERANLFQEFYRVKSHKTSGIAGTGLGLATVKRVLGEYNGRISVQSKPDAGSMFTVVFPKDHAPA
jgi:two-component system, OmpR family, phosphate regulon sensor histidine kinase PhoR